MAYQNIIKPYQNDLGSAINELIKQNIKNIDTIFLARVENISEDKKKADIIDIIKSDSNVTNPIIPNVLIAQPYSQAWKFQFKIEKGDIGLAFVCKKDISTYKNNGASNSIANTARNFDVIDSIFMPLSLYLQSDNENIGFLIESKDGKNKIEFDKDGNLSIISGSPITIGTTKTLLDCFSTLLDNLEKGIVGGIISPASQTITQLPTYSAQKQVIMQTIQEVLK